MHFPLQLFDRLDLVFRHQFSGDGRKGEFSVSRHQAKTATDTGDLAHSQSLLAHKKRDMTEHYVRRHRGQRVKPLRGYRLTRNFLNSANHNTARDASIFSNMLKPHQELILRIHIQESVKQGF
jgi:hypothetical protein